MKKNIYIPKKRNRILEASLKFIHDRIQKDLPYMYSAVSIAVYNLVDGDEEEKTQAVIKMIEESNRVWQEVIENGKDVIEECEKITGIDIRKSVE